MFSESFEIAKKGGVMPGKIEYQSAEGYQIGGINEEELTDLAELFKMFADSTRIKILYDLFGGEKIVSEI